jgi:hypothetical protein
MPSLRVHKDFQLVRKLPFCYLCGRDFVPGDEVNGDHVPPASAFSPADRANVLKLQTHKVCNSAHSVNDKRVGQLIALRRREGPRSPRDEALTFGHFPGLGVAVTNLDVDVAIWRWIKGFHAALYRQPLMSDLVAIVTPFPRADQTESVMRLQPLRPQHRLAVEVIKTNRAARNLDLIRANNGKLRYECVWCQADDGERWFCFLALDIYDWKDLGSHSKEIPGRGCTGVYALPDHSVPAAATRNRKSVIAISNLDELDPFGP